MLSNWMKILPIFIIKPIAKKYCERVEKGGKTYVIAFEDVLIKID